MPIYEYRCDSCGHELEKLQRMSEDPLKDCPSCGESALRRLVSAAAFRLKGGGWYETDFKQDNKRNLVESPDKGEAKSDAGKSDSTKSESPKSEKTKSGASKSSDSKGSASKKADAA